MALVSQSLMSLLIEFVVIYRMSWLIT